MPYLKNYDEIGHLIYADEFQAEHKYLKNLKTKVANHAYEFNKPLIEIVDDVDNHLIKEHRSIWNACLASNCFRSSENIADDVKKLVDRLSNPEIKDGTYIVSVLIRKFKHADLNVKVHHLSSDSNNDLTPIDDLETAVMRHDFEMALGEMLNELTSDKMIKKVMEEN